MLVIFYFLVITVPINQMQLVKGSLLRGTAALEASLFSVNALTYFDYNSISVQILYLELNFFINSQIEPFSQYKYE